MNAIVIPESSRSGGRTLPLGARQQRSEGAARIAFKRRKNATVLDDLFQSGCMKARFPKRVDTDRADAVLINTAGGLTGGDVLQTEVAWKRDTCAAVSTQAAERIYKSHSGIARVDVRLNVDAGASAMWLPQETIFFDGGQMRWMNHVCVAKSGRLLATEQIVFGRTAMGETVETGFISDGWRITYDDRLVFADSFRIDGDIRKTLNRPAIAAGGQALATVLMVGDDAPENLDRWRAVAANLDCLAGCSAIGPVLVARMIAETGDHLRGNLVTFLEHAIERFSPEKDARLPRVWSC